MADGTHISWTEATWNPVTGCSVISPGCVPCYAMQLAGTRLQHHPSRAGLTTMTKTGPVWNGEVRFNQQWLDQPLKWTRPRRIFVVAHGDLFHEKVDRLWQCAVFDVMRRATWHEFQVLTKRTEAMADFALDTAPMRHVLLGTSIEDQVRAVERLPHLRTLAEAGWRTWVSYEPALGPIDWGGAEFLKWIVSGGQSKQGSNEARPSHPAWHRATRDFCASNGIPYHFKQWGDWAPCDRGHVNGEILAEPKSLDEPMKRFGSKMAGAMLDGREWREFPTP